MDMTVPQLKRLAWLFGGVFVVVMAQPVMWIFGFTTWAVVFIVGITPIIAVSYFNLRDFKVREREWLERRERLEVVGGRISPAYDWAVYFTWRLQEDDPDFFEMHVLYWPPNELLLD